VLIWFGHRPVENRSNCKNDDARNESTSSNHGGAPFLRCKVCTPTGQRKTPIAGHTESAQASLAKVKDDVGTQPRWLLLTRSCDGERGLRNDILAPVRRMAFQPSRAG
jgi:hypothetical protein